MADQLTLRSGTAADADLLRDHFTALRTIRSVRWVFYVPLILALLVPVAVFWVAWNQIPPASAAPQSPEPVNGAEDSGWQRSGVAALRFAACIAVVGVVLLAVLYLLAVNVCLTGRLGGAHHAISALLWMVLLGFCILPWQGWFGISGVAQMFYSMDVLLESTRLHRSGDAAALAYYSRFLGLPLCGLIAAAVADLRFGRCYRAALQRVRLHLEGK